MEQKTEQSLEYLYREKLKEITEFYIDYYKWFTSSNKTSRAKQIIKIAHVINRNVENFEDKIQRKHIKPSLLLSNNHISSKSIRIKMLYELQMLKTFKKQGVQIGDKIIKEAWVI
ncbi:hypothetical protein [Staphylococcus equorum]|uniref:Uncharacterized protein n=1 Tax=Staphylococcus equorum TaxID=246432 RepID=A0AAP7IF95_9STAP|nr:hypothetical protein [Staphylococcus equorum]OEK58929.1 hypothetical protein ASS94_00980 [Staphylococcus equorum]